MGLMMMSFICSYRNKKRHHHHTTILKDGLEMEQAVARKSAGTLHPFCV
jgi:hypothetical protein